jgi:hypothetical protein
LALTLIMTSFYSVIHIYSVENNGGMVFITAFNNNSAIWWRSVLLVEKTQSSESDNVPYNTESLKRSGFKRMLSAAKRMALARRG